jgi:RimJ/RimL family protein N-acetyltransferase
MLIIRHAQQQALRAALIPGLAARWLSYLRTHHRSATAQLSDAALSSTVTRSLERAHRYGLTWESSLVCFAALALEIGPLFDLQPRIHAALTDTARPPDQRLEGLFDVTTKADWQEAAALGISGETDPFLLVPVRPEHAPSLAALLTTFGPEPPLAADGVAGWIEASLRARAQGREFAFALMATGNAPLGVCTVRRTDGAARLARLSYWIAPAHRRRGYATIAAQRVAAFGFARLGMAAIDARIAADNLASRRVLEKLGAIRIPDTSVQSEDVEGARFIQTYRLPGDQPDGRA